MTSQTLDTEAAWNLILQAKNRTDGTLQWPGSDVPALELNGIGGYRAL